MVHISVKPSLSIPSILRVWKIVVSGLFVTDRTVQGPGDTCQRVVAWAYPGDLFQGSIPSLRSLLFSTDKFVRHVFRCSHVRYMIRGLVWNPTLSGIRGQVLQLFQLGLGVLNWTSCLEENSRVHAHCHVTWGIPTWESDKNLWEWWDEYPEIVTESFICYVI